MLIDGWRDNRLRAAVAFVGLLFLAGCVPSDPIGLGPTAVRVSGDAIEILYAGCASEDVKSVAVIKPNDPHVFKESDPPVWKISFEAPSPMKRFVVGETPDGATEDIHLDQPLEPDVHYEAMIVLASGVNPRQGFILNELDGQVGFHGKYMSTSEFEREAACTSSSP